MDATALRPNQRILVDGTVNYCRLTRKIEGVALDEYNKKSRSQYPEQKPFYTITIDNPVIVKNPGPKTPEEEYVEQKFYDSKVEPKKCFRINSKAPNPPKFYQSVIDENGQMTNRIQEKPHIGELAQGLKVRLVLRVYQYGNSPAQKSLNLDSVITQEPIRYYQRGENSAIASLKEMGLIVENMSPEDKEKENAFLAGIATNPAPQAQPVQQTPPTPNATPYRNTTQAPMTPPVQQAPPAQPVNNGTWECSVCQRINDADARFCSGCGQPKDDTTSSNYRPQGGIQFDPNDTYKNY